MFEELTKRSATAADVLWSLKWVVPTIAASVMLVMLLGGIEGDAKLVIVPMMAPMFVLGPKLEDLGNTGVILAVLIEILYVLVVMIIVRRIWKTLFGDVDSD